MQSIVEHLSAEHESCDRLFARIAAAIDSGDMIRVQAAYHAFRHAMQRHLAVEDAILFPAFEAGSDILGVTHMMRMEHEQMQELVHQLQAALDSGNPQSCAAALDLLSALMLQHNLKEEQMLYPLLERALQGKADGLVRRIEALPQPPA
jgi:iron-sulfur cluster repair protein YtfE (RIC family)